MKKLIKNGLVVNENSIKQLDILIENDLILKVDKDISDPQAIVIDATGMHIFPGVIDDQVHFREPGLTHKANLYTESRAAVAGGITSFMEMPNTVPNTLTQELLEDKYHIASKNSIANYSFFMGASNDNIKEVLKTDKKNVCGVKIFMGSSTGNMLVDNEKTLENIFSKCDMLIASHCEDESTIQQNILEYKSKYGDNIPVKYHPLIRSREACFLSSSKAIELAKKNNARLHVLHISTAEEVALFERIPLSEKKITAEACIHHLWFDDSQYETKGNYIKWNPAVKSSKDRDAILNGVLNGNIDVIATDHAPHTIEEKDNVYSKAPSGGPLVQHALVAMLDLYHQGKISLEMISQKMSHSVADLFSIDKRGYIKEGYFADLVLVNLDSKWTVNKSNILYKCGWSPFENHTFKSEIKTTFVNGNEVYSNGRIIESSIGRRLSFNH